jgi:hypothetical protein
MFNYQPNQSRAGEFLAQGITNSAQIRAQADLDKAMRRHNMIVDGAGLVGDIAKTAVGFAVGGPAGAAMASGGGGSGGGDGGIIGSLISSFANKKAMDAKDKAYMGFFERHGDQLGFDGDYLAQLKNMDRDERVAAFDLMTGQPGQRLGSLNYLNQQMSPRAAYGTGAAASAAPRESFTF